jgi:hypothetical protein
MFSKFFPTHGMFFSMQYAIIQHDKLRLINLFSEENSRSFMDHQKSYYEVQKIVRDGADPNAICPNNKTVLMNAILHKFPAHIIRLLLENTTNINYTTFHV